MRWEDLNARARGLATHLLGAAHLEALTREPDTAALVRGLRESAYGEALPVAPTPAGLDLAVRRAAALRLALLVRRAAARRRAFVVFTAEEDRRSVRALMRGAMAGAAVEARLAGLMPTPSLPERALETLAALPGPGPVAATLVAWKDPFGAATLEEATRAQPDLTRIEHALAVTYATLAVRAARRGGRTLRAFVAESIDAENIRAAVVLAGADAARIGDAFLEGGRRITAELFATAAAQPAAERALAAIAAALGPRDRLGAVLARVEPERLEAALLRFRLVRWRRAARLRPIGAAPVLAYLLALRAELADLRTIAWGVAMGAPPADLHDRLVSVA